MEGTGGAEGTEGRGELERTWLGGLEVDGKDGDVREAGAGEAAGGTDTMRAVG